MNIVYLTIAFIALLSYIHRKYVTFLVCYLALMSNIFMLNLPPSPIRGSDICLGLGFILIPFVAGRFKNAYSLKGDKFAKLLYIFIAFYIAEFFITIASGAEYVQPALKVIRGIFIFLSYFVFRTIPLEKYKRFLIIGFWITLIQGVLFYLQFIGINALAGGVKTGVLSFNYAINIPTMCFFYIFFSLKSSYTRRYRYVVLTFFLGILLITMVRSMLIATMIGIIIFMFINRSSKQTIVLAIAFLIISPIVLSAIEKKSDSSSSVSTMDDIRQVFSGVETMRNINSSSGTFSFRIGMLVERIDYLIKNPEYLLTGVGTIHEDSPKCYKRFKFYLGTRNDERYYQKCIIESGDITWVPIALRYGLLGLALHIYLFYYIIKTCRKRKDLLQILFPLYIVLFLLSFNGPFYERPTKLFEVCLYLAILARTYKENRELII